MNEFTYGRRMDMRICADARRCNTFSLQFPLGNIESHLFDGTILLRRHGQMANKLVPEQLDFHLIDFIDANQYPLPP